MPAGGVKDESLLEAQAEVVRSSDVLWLAENSRGLSDLPSLAKFTNPIPVVKRELRVEPHPRRNLLTVTYASTHREDAAKVVETVVEAYRRYQSEKPTRRAAELSEVVRAERMKVDQELDRAQRTLAEFDLARGATAASEATTQRAASLADALSRGELETFAAKRAYDDAIADAGPALAGLDDKQLEETLRGSASTPAADTGEVVGQEVLALARQLVELRRRYAENHPSVIRAAQRLQQMRLAQVAGTRQRWQAAQAREVSLRETFEKVQRETAAQASRAAERTRLTAEVERARSRADAMDRQLNEILLTTAAGALMIRVDAPAEVNAADHPPLPRPAPTLATAAAIGLVLGGLFALVGEFREAGSLRHVVPLRAAEPTASDAGSILKLRVLASVPTAEREVSDAPRDLARAAQLDPFGPIANAVRTMRVAMEVNGQLPATILLTAAADRQGTTTIAVNLAETIARENRRVLLVDLHFTAPMAAKLLDVDTPRGLAELIEGGDPTELIRPSDVPRLDVLPAGTPPKDSGALLNSERFAALITMLASAYDHVIFDAPPLARGDDARIVASICDGTVLVSRPTQASLRRAAGARDLLLMIGANLLGVTISRSDLALDVGTPAGGVVGGMGVGGGS